MVSRVDLLEFLSCDASMFAAEYSAVAENAALAPASAAGCRPDGSASHTRSLSRAPSGSPQRPGVRASVDLEPLFAKARAVVLGRIRNVNELTEREVLAAGDLLERIVAQAQAYVGKTQGAIASLSGDTPESASVQSVLEHQTDAVSEFLESARQHLQEQAEVAAVARDSTERMRHLTESIGAIAVQARVLSLNASIEASRLGDSAAGFDLIASEMKRLSDAVEESNRAVSALAGELSRNIGTLADHASQVRDRASSFGDRIEHSTAQVKAASKSLDETLHELAVSGGEALRDVIATSQAALTHLAFQDPAAQGLLVIDRDLEVLADLVGRAARGEAIDATPLDGTSAHPELCAGRVAILDRHSDAPDAGDVILF